MRIRRKFLQLTSFTYPHGFEFKLESYLPKGVKKDNSDNYYFIIGENPTTMFTCHLDTACSKHEKVQHVFENDGNIIKTNGKTILGADDKAGMIVILYMIENNIPGLYYFFVGEEVGCIGSSDAAEDWEFNNIKKVVSFDRRGTNSVITHQLYGRCCSDDFAKELSTQLNQAGSNLKLSPDPTGIMTDSAQFMEIIPECTNISVGYYKEHTVDEYQDIQFLSNLCRSVVKVDWENLPVKRNPLDMDDAYWREGSYIGSFDNDEELEYTESYYTYVKSKQGSKKMYLSKKRAMEEKTWIYQWIFRQDGYYDMTGIIWNGYKLYVESRGGLVEFVGTRIDIMEWVPDLSSIPTKYLSNRLSRKKESIIL